VRVDCFYANSPELAAKDWVVETHKAATTVWNLVPDTKLLDDSYYDQVLPILDRQLGLAGLRLASFLNSAYSSNTCPAQ
jgi:hypothetical protein